MSEGQTAPALRSRLMLEPLEERIAPAGNIVVTVSGGNLTITGDAGSNEFTIDDAGLALQQVRITSAAGTTINGLAGIALFSGVKGIKASLGDGNDDITLDGLSLAKDVVIDTGAGDDDVTVTGATTISGSLASPSR